MCTRPCIPRIEISFRTEKSVHSTFREKKKLNKVNKCERMSLRRSKQKATTILLTVCMAFPGRYCFTFNAHVMTHNEIFGH